MRHARGPIQNIVHIKFCRILSGAQKTVGVESCTSIKSQTLTTIKLIRQLTNEIDSLPANLGPYIVQDGIKAQLRTCESNLVSVPHTIRVRVPVEEKGYIICCGSLDCKVKPPQIVATRALDAARLVGMAVAI